MTDNEGRFSLADVFEGVGRVTVSGDQLVTRETRILTNGIRTDVAIDVIPAGFSTFYRYIARDGYDQPNFLKPLSRWTTDPSIYIKTTLEDVPEQVPADVIGDIAVVLRNSVSELTIGRYSVKAIEVGDEPRPRTLDWIIVQFRRSLPGGILGQAFVGANPGLIEIVYDPERDARRLSNPRNCRSMSVELAEHEVTHALGFWHTDTALDLIGRQCSGTGRPARVLQAAAIVYSRPRRNFDPDHDPADTVLSLDAEDTQPVACRANHVW